jgi:radical SAM superfamily enzyme YgiQ (UPF0313 family)
MRLTLIFPAIGRRRGSAYLRLWQMEPLSMAMLAALTPPEVEVRFYDDRVEPIPFEEPTDLVAMSVETYTARRAYQIASEYRKRHVPVVLGGFHATLCPEETARYAEAVVLGEAEELWPQVLDDFRHGTPQRFYRQPSRPRLNGVAPRREIFRGKRYLPLSLVEAGRGCVHACEFCSVQSMYRRTHQRRPIDTIVSELHALRGLRRPFFFVDDNVTAQAASAKDFLRALVPLGIRWIGQMSITAAHDEEWVELLERSGCAGVLIGFESLDPRNLSAMGKDFNARAGDYERAVANLHRHRIGIYGTFVFGYEEDTPQSIADALHFAQQHGFYLAAFNHLVPFPGTPVYERFARDGRLVQQAWWRDPHYGFNQVAFRPAKMSGEELHHQCLAARRAFYSPGSAWRRHRLLRREFALSQHGLFWALNLMHRAEVRRRDGFPLGDESWQGPLLEAN